MGSRSSLRPHAADACPTMTPATRRSPMAVRPRTRRGTSGSMHPYTRRSRLSVPTLRMVRVRATCQDAQTTILSASRTRDGAVVAPACAGRIPVAVATRSVVSLPSFAAHVAAKVQASADLLPTVSLHVHHGGVRWVDRTRLRRRCARGRRRCVGDGPCGYRIVLAAKVSR